MSYTTKLSTQSYISNCWSSIIQNPHGGLDVLSASTAVEETNGVESDGVERESAGDLESFVMKNEMIQGGLIFIGSKISEAILNQNRC
jgi:hypothetical protein